MIKIKTSSFLRSLNKLSLAFHEAGEKAIRDTVKAATRVAKNPKDIRKRSGFLRKNTIGTYEGLHGKVVADTPYAWFLEAGTSTHWIPVRRARALHWVSRGKHFFSKGHEVRGIWPRKFMTEAKDEGEQVLELAMESYAGRAIREFNQR